jgi:hypothetical protein
MKIDLDRLTESQLIDLNHRIIARLRMFAQLRAHTSMSSPNADSQNVLAFRKE